MKNPNRQIWNQQQQALRKRLARPEDHQKAIELFLGQHAMMHTAEMSHAGLWSFEDEALAGLTGEQMRLIPRNGDHSIAWVLWHMTRIEDVTMNLLVAGNSQVLFLENWLERMRVSQKDTGNSMDASGLTELGASIDLDELHAYRLSVGRRTRTIAQKLLPEQMKSKVNPDRLQQITLEGAVLEAASGLLEYWGGLTIAGLLLMPPTRHNFIHWNEVLRIKQKVG
jgi:hypothetical protein